jgi:tetratricopeptide (TPR) repeat protein
MNPSQVAVSLNNQAASLLSSPQNYSAALLLLKEALANMKRTMQAPHAGFMNCRDAETASFEIDLLDCMCRSMSLTCILDDDHTYFMHRQGIFIPLELGNSTGYRERSMISCMIIFNLAIASHLSAVDHAEGDIVSSLHRALKLYELAFNLQRQEIGEPNVFELAITNNVALVHKQLGEEEHAATCFEMVLSTLMYLADQRRSSSFSLEGFFINTRHLISKEAVAPAA